MIRKIAQFSVKSNYVAYVLARKYSSSPVNPKKWDLYAGVLVERVQVLSKTLTPLEEKYNQLLLQLEFEGSLKSDHEVQHEKDMKQAELVKKGLVEIDLDDTTAKQTAQDKKDAYVEELNKFQLADRITEDDKKQNLKSTNRNLENTLYLLVEQKLGSKTHSILPQGIRLEGETMRQTAERVLRERCGDSIEVTLFSNAPCGFYKYKYPVEQRKEVEGAKVFFYRCFLKKGNVDQKVAPQFEWLDKQQLQKKLQGSYSDSVDKFLL